MHYKNNHFDRSLFITAMQKAFIDDPLYQYISDDHVVRENIISIVYDMMINNSAGDFYIDNSLPQAGAVWMNLQEKGNSSVLTGLKVHLRMLFSGGIRRIATLDQPFKQLDQRQKELYQESDYYLSLLFVSPEMQGKRLASKLLSEQLNKFDQEHLTCSLDTFNPNNIGLYERFGFQLVSEIPFQGSLVSYQLQRLPQST